MGIGPGEALALLTCLLYTSYYLHANTYNHLEGAHNDAALAVCDAVAAEGVEFFFNSPAVQLYKEGERVAGVICSTEEGNVLFKAAKGVIPVSYTHL